MALVRVYCGLAAAAPRQQAEATATSLTVALVDDAGRVLDVCDLDDQASGYAFLSTLLAERASGPYSVAIAADSDQHLVSRLLTAAGWALAFADDRTTDDYADRFADDLADDARTAPRQRRALGLARALHNGAFTATTLPAPPELVDLKPVLAADGALANGRYGTAVALREVLRELYPAALRAYPDPADPVALAVMDALPEPSTLATSSGGRGRDAAATADAVTAQLTAQGVADAGTIAEAITALRVAIAETPRRVSLGRAFAPAVAETVRRSVAAVRACDEARAVLINTLAERMQAATQSAPQWTAPTPPEQPAASGQRHAPAEQPYAPAEQRHALAERHAAAEQPYAVPEQRQPAPEQPQAAPERPAAVSAGSRPVSSPPPPPPGITPITETRPARFGQAAPSERPGVAAEAPYAEVRVPTPRPAPEGPPPGSRTSWPTSPPPDDWARSTAQPDGWGTPSAQHDGWGAAPAQPDSHGVPAGPAGWGRAAEHAEQPARGRAAEHAEQPGRRAPAEQPAARSQSVAPPWQADDLRPPEPPALRLVEPTLPEELRGDLQSGGYGGWSDPPPLRLVDSDEGIPRSVPPVDTSQDDDDLLIFAQARSAWFSDSDDSAWNPSVDAGWRAAEQAAHPEIGDQTDAGLPRRVPRANLVPGSPPTDQERQLRVVRDPASIAAHTSGYFNGWRRGQEVGGYPLGTRASRASVGAWDFARDPHAS